MRTIMRFWIPYQSAVAYSPLCYVLLFPGGCNGWYPERRTSGLRTKKEEIFFYGVLFMLFVPAREGAHMSFAIL